MASAAWLTLDFLSYTFYSHCALPWKGLFFDPQTPNSKVQVLPILQAQSNVTFLYKVFPE